MNIANAALAPVHRDAASASGRVGPSTPNVFPLPDGKVGILYNVDVASFWSCATNASPVFAFTWTPPNPVPGLSFASSGLISGTPVTAGFYSAPGTVADMSGRTRRLRRACGVYL